MPAEMLRPVTTRIDPSPTLSPPNKHLCGLNEIKKNPPTKAPLPSFNFLGGNLTLHISLCRPAPEFPFTVSPFASNYYYYYVL